MLKDDLKRKEGELQAKEARMAALEQKLAEKTAALKVEKTNHNMTLKAFNFGGRVAGDYNCLGIGSLQTKIKHNANLRKDVTKKMDAMFGGYTNIN